MPRNSTHRSRTHRSTKKGMQAELDRLRQELETMNAAEQGVPIRNLAVQEPSSTSKDGVLKKTTKRGVASKVMWLAILVGAAFGIYALVKFMQDNNIQFTQGEAGTTPITMQEVALHNKPEDCWLVYHG